ncbi:hypothetical protein ACHAXA_010462, partial [Cyclostephanos tholiformis]
HDDGVMLGDNDNPYLAMRAAKIARNERRLRELGLLVASSSSSSSSTSRKRHPPPPPPPSSSSLTPSRRNPRRSAHFPAPISPPNGPQPPPRRSDRISSSSRAMGRGDSSVFVVTPREDVGGSTMIGSTERRPPRSSYLPSVVPPPPGSCGDISVDDTSPHPHISSAPANSVRSVNLDVEVLVLGGRRDDAVDDEGRGGGMLGRMVERTGKECVVRSSIAVASSEDDALRLLGSGTRVSFNKYSGVQEWKNSVFLWVNLGTTDSPNEFLDDGKMVTWYGGSRMHDGSPVIRELLRRGRGGSSSNIVMWCRRYRPEVKAFTPYVCFGRMGYRSHVQGSRPLAFVWDLLDYDGLRKHSDPAVRETFDLFTRR